jgi:YVTN family beta-propeller protein
MLVGSATGQSFVNWETPHVHPLEITPDGNTLLAVNTPDNRLEVFDISTGYAIHRFDIPVGLDPVSVRARNNDEIWVANHVSDSVSIVSLGQRSVVATITTDDEPCDIAFAGTPTRAFVSCSQVNRVLVYDPDNLAMAPSVVAIEGEEPRALEVSSDGQTVYVAVFESGNGTTILGGGSTIGGGFPPNVVNHPAGPHGGTNPPPNDGASFTPGINGANPSAPAVGMIVRKNEAGQWMDDNGGNWTDLVSGANANLSGRLPGWDLPDHDVAIIDANSLTDTYATGLMNICMAISVNPGSGNVFVVGTDATNEIRFEPNLNGRFLRVNMASFSPGSPGSSTIVDLNDHLTYETSTIDQTERDKSIGDPRGIAWNGAGTIAYISGMGSNNVIVIDAGGQRAGLAPTIAVGEGPTGVQLDESRDRLYVLNKFESSVSVVDTNAEQEIAAVPFHDPSPTSIRIGRRHLYNTRETSGLGHASCGSCHVDARMDRLAWDLGDPSGEMSPFDQNCGNGIDGNCQDWHPMKGPMTTQTLQDIIGLEPLHWRGDRDGIEEFNPAFEGLLGDDVQLSNAEMQEFEDFLASIFFPPNPFRNFDNSLPTNLPLPGHFTTGRFAPPGQPLPNGNAVTGLDRYRNGGLDGVECVSCHTLPVGVGSNYALNGPIFAPLPPGPNGEMHHAIVSVDGSTNVSIKTPHLRNVYEKVGFETTQLINHAGFGFLHDGSVDSIARFISEPVFSVTSDQDVADIVAFMLAFSGSDLPMGSATNPLELPGPLGQDTHAAVGKQATIPPPSTTAGTDALIADMIALAESSAVGLVVKSVQDGEPRGYAYLVGGTFQSDRQAESLPAAALESLGAAGAELTYTVVPLGSQTRIGIDRDEDGFLDRDELDACSDPADASSTPGPAVVDGDFDGDGDVDENDVAMFSLCLEQATGTAPDECRCTFDFDNDDDVDCLDFEVIIEFWTEGGQPPAPAQCSGAQVPAVSDWGVLIMALFLMTCGTLLMARLNRELPAPVPARTSSPRHRGRPDRSNAIGLLPTGWI